MARPPSPHSRTCRWRSTAVSSSASSAPPGAASRRCCRWSPGSTRPTEGTIDIADGRPAVMFQDPGLLPWLTVRRNVELPMRIHKVSNVERDKTVNRLLAMVGLIDFAESRPHQLSGGMRQRCALARALAQDSELLLMDEPFAALDAITRDQLHDDLNRIWQETGPHDHLRHPQRARGSSPRRPGDAHDPAPRSRRADLGRRDPAAPRARLLRGVGARHRRSPAQLRAGAAGNGTQ